MVKRFFGRLTAAGLFLAMLVGCASDTSLLTGEKGYYQYSWEEEVRLGQRSDAQIVQEMGLYPDDALQAYVRDIGERILDQSVLRQPDAPEIYRNTKFTFRVLDSPIVNAFALPGGFVYVTRGLLAHMDNEAQLAVVLGHEITHVAARHSSKQAFKQQIGQIGLLAGAIIGQHVSENPNMANQILDVGGGVFQLMSLKYGRDDERESDQFGVEYAAKAGYDAAEGADFFRTLSRLSSKSGQSIPSWFSSHPDPGEREMTIKRLASQWAASYPEQKIRQPALYNQIEGLVVGENPRNGFQYQGTFYHPDMRFSFDIPSGWRLRNESAAVYLLDPDQRGMMTFSLSKESSPLEAARAFVQESRIQVNNSGSTRIKGFEAYGVEGLATSGSSSLWVHNVFIAFEGKIFSFLGYARSETVDSYRPLLLKVSRGFQKLRDRKFLDVQPATLKIAKANASQPFRRFLPERLPSGMDVQDWAIINQVGVDQVIQEGSLLKLPN